MGIWDSIKNGWNKAKTTVSKIANTVGSVAGKIAEKANLLSAVPVIGGFASTVGNVANMIAKGAGWTKGLIATVDAFGNTHEDTLSKVATAGEALYNSGLADKMTGGAVSKIVDWGGKQIDKMGLRQGRAPKMLDKKNEAHQHAKGFRPDLSPRGKYA